MLKLFIIRCSNVVKSIVVYEVWTGHLSIYTLTSWAPMHPSATVCSGGHTV